MLGGVFGPGDIKFRCDRAKSGEIAIVFLCGGDFGYDGVEVGIELRIALDAKLIGGALDNFVHIGIVVSGTLVETFNQAAGDGEVVDSTGFFASFEAGRYGHATTRNQPRGPESIVKMDLGECDGFDTVISDCFGGDDPCGQNG
jgi:hypothetical protein